jgi:hypothetical protein
MKKSENVWLSEGKQLKIENFLPNYSSFEGTSNNSKIKACDGGKSGVCDK